MANSFLPTGDHNGILLPLSLSYSPLGGEMQEGGQGTGQGWQMAGGSPSFAFTASQVEELHVQMDIFKNLVTGVPVPQELLLSLLRSLESMAARLYNSHQVGYYSCFAIKKYDTEPGRCRRTDGKKWRCGKGVHPGSKYCERHMHRGRNRSRKPVQIFDASVNGGWRSQSIQAQSLVNARAPHLSTAQFESASSGMNSQELSYPYEVSHQGFQSSSSSSGSARGGLGMEPPEVLSNNPWGRMQPSDQMSLHFNHLSQMLANVNASAQQLGMGMGNGNGNGNGTYPPGPPPFPLQNLGQITVNSSSSSLPPPPKQDQFPHPFFAGAGSGAAEPAVVKQYQYSLRSVINQEEEWPKTTEYPSSGLEDGASSCSFNLNSNTTTCQQQHSSSSSSSIPVPMAPASDNFPSSSSSSRTPSGGASSSYSGA